ncbi:MAG: cyclic nucleotide-binding domain-containing protein [Proteobacteria bacterium]|nr:cyclic nucleotide-binding domain-containing protein [Pseudomonadota bacterium]
MGAGKCIRIVCAILFLGFFWTYSPAFGQSSPLTLSQALSRVALFSDLTEMERSRLADAAFLRRGQAGEQIIHQGKARDRMFILLEGKAEVRVNGKHLTTISGQALVGEIEFLDKLPASADVILLEETDLIELDYGALTRLMEGHPRLGYVIMGGIARIEARRLRGSNPK